MRRISPRVLLLAIRAALGVTAILRLLRRRRLVLVMLLLPITPLARIPLVATIRRLRGGRRRLPVAGRVARR